MFMTFHHEFDHHESSTHLRDRSDFLHTGSHQKSRIEADTQRLPSNLDQNYQENPKKGPDREKCQRADLERIKP